MVKMFYDKRIEGKSMKKTIIDKGRVGLFSVVQKRVTESYFHTSEGYVKVDPILSIICVESSKGYLEVIAGTKITKSVELIRELIRSNVAFEDIETVVELSRDEEEINSTVENRLQFLHFLEEKKARMEARKAAEKEVAVSILDGIPSKDIQEIEENRVATKTIIDEDEERYIEKEVTVITTYRRIRR
jgi:hypothetical protein